MGLDGLVPYAEQIGDLTVGQALSQVAQNFQFSICETGVPFGRLDFIHQAAGSLW